MIIMLSSYAEFSCALCKKGTCSVVVRHFRNAQLNLASNAIWPPVLEMVLKLGMVTIDQIHPLSDLLASLNKLSILPPEFEGKLKMREWISKLLKMGASKNLAEL